MLKFRNWLESLSEKISNLKFLQVMQQAFMMVMPLLIIGSFFSLFQGLPVEAWQTFMSNTGLNNVIGLPYTYTFSWMSLYITFCTGYVYSNRSGNRKNAIAVGLLCIIFFFLLCPADDITTYVSSIGMFMAILVGFFVGWLYKLCIDKNLTIKMPDEVPPTVAQAFSNLIPGVLIILVGVVIHYVFSLTPLGSAQNAFYTLIRLPLSVASNNIFGEILIGTYCSLMWFFGIHGGMAVYPIDMALFLPNQAANLAAYNAGEPLPYMYTGLGSGIGMAGYTILLAIWLTCKNKKMREICKVAAVPAFFGIAEPYMFGLPIIMNPIYFIPYVITSPLFTVLMHAFQKIGFLPYCNGVSVPYTLPASVKVFLHYGWQGVVTFVIFTIIGLLLYIPFVKMHEEQLNKEAKASEE